MRLELLAKPFEAHPYEDPLRDEAHHEGLDDVLDEGGVAFAALKGAAEAGYAPIRLRLTAGSNEESRQVVRAFAKRGLIACLVSVVGAGLVGPGTAAATFDTSTIKLDSSHGYGLTIVGNNQPYPFGGSGTFVGITAHKDSHAYSSYDVAGKSTAKTLKADFGEFGKVDLTFHQKHSTNPPLPGPKCHGKYKRTSGIWKGTIKFKGENDYTKLSATSAEGNHTMNGVRCPGGGRTHKHVHLLAQASNGMFQADVRKKAGERPTFSAFLSSASGAVSIFRTASVNGPPSKFSYNGGYTHATVKPPAPFSGTGTFDSPSSWTGSLTVDLPGAPNTVIAGPGWSASLGEQNEKP